MVDEQIAVARAKAGDVGQGPSARDANIAPIKEES